MNVASDKKLYAQGASHFAVGLLLVGAIWLALPARWWPVDFAGTGLAGLFAASGVGLALGARWAQRLAIFTNASALVAGATSVTGLAWGAAYVAGLYGTIGAGMALMFAAVALLVLPYLVVLPAAQLYRLLRSSR